MRLAISVAAVCAAVIVVVALAGGEPGAGAAGAPARAGGFYGTPLRARAQAARFALRDQDGRLVKLAAYRGRVVAIALVWTTCTSCALVVGALENALAELPRAIPALAISLDPVADTRARVQAFLVRQQLVGRLPYLAGTPAAWRALGARARSPAIVLVDRAGRARVRYGSLARMNPDAIAADIRRLQSP